jgi:uncharacterized membrane protein YesL
LKELYSFDSQENEKPKKKRRFNIFDSQREGKGVSKEDAIITPDLKGFFKSFSRHFSKLLSVNILMVVGNFPILFAILGLSGIFKTQYFTPQSNFFANLHGIMLNEASYSPATMALFGIEGIQIENSATTPISNALLILSLLVFFTFGFVNVGTTYIIRNMVKGEPVFMLADFKYAIKRNKKQAFFFGILDLLVLVLIPFNIFTLLSSMTTVLSSIIFWLNVVFGILYIFMRFYIYMQMITFELSIYKILKNSLIFALIGFKRNIMALLGIICLIFIEYMLIFGLGGMLLPLGLALPLVALFACGSYMAAFASYYKIKEIMIDPYVSEAEDEEFTDPIEDI